MILLFINIIISPNDIKIQLNTRRELASVGKELFITVLLFAATGGKIMAVKKGVHVLRTSIQPH